MKYNAIVESGIKIVERVPIPPELIPKDAQVDFLGGISPSHLNAISVHSGRDRRQGARGVPRRQCLRHSHRKRPEAGQGKSHQRVLVNR